MKNSENHIKFCGFAGQDTAGTSLCGPKEWVGNHRNMPEDAYSYGSLGQCGRLLMESV